jgi:hypothetical protein
VTDVDQNGPARVAVDFKTPAQAAAWTNWLRAMEKLGGPEVDVVQMTEADSAERSGISPSNLFLVVPARREEHGPSIYELVATPEPVAEETPTEQPPPTEHGLKPPTGAAPF